MASNQTPGALFRLWVRWKTLRLPWRKQFLIGSDLSGNTYWEFRDPLNPGRSRRKMQPYRFQSHISSSAAGVSPSWHQWLRRVRDAPPSQEEQIADVRRLESTRVLAARADERWAKGESLLAAPRKRGEEIAESDKEGGKEESPWDKGKKGPGEAWQPESWSPAPAGRR